MPNKEIAVKSCIFCEHCSHSEPIWYSELTGGESGYFSCNVNQEQTLLEDEHLNNLAGWTLRANTCKHYQLDTQIKLELKL